jgi:fatty acid-binding protein DegV
MEIVEEQCPKNAEAHLCVMQADARPEAEALVMELQVKMKLTGIPVYELPPAIVVHGGPGAMAVGFFAD